MSDPVTIISISSVSALLSLIVMGSLARNRLPGSIEWCWANGLYAVGMVLAVNIGGMPSILTIVIANGCTGAATALQLIGLRRFFRCHTPFGLVVTSWVTMICCIAIFLYIDNNFPARVVVFSVYHTLFQICATATVIMYRPRDRPKYAYVFMIGICGMATLINLVRGLAYLLGNLPNTPPLVATPLHMTFLAIGTLGAPALTIGLVMMSHDRMSAALERHANIDYLTDLLGRRAFSESASKECLRAGRFDRPLAIAILDLDHFKQINDRYGHAVGDNVLAHFAQVLSRSTRTSDICGRIGGEEFAMLLPETDLFAACDVLARFRAILAQRPCKVGSRAVPLTFSAGIAIFRNGESFSALMARADQALYRAKRDGRNRTAVHEKVDNDDDDGDDAEASIRNIEALLAGDLSVIQTMPTSPTMPAPETEIGTAGGARAASAEETLRVPHIEIVES